MANIHRAPKQWSLSRNETVNSFENWKQNLQYTLALDVNFAPFLLDGVRWAKKTRAAPLRGFVDDGEGVRGGCTAQQKVNMLELMLGQIANYCPVISRQTIVKNSTSVESIWQTIRLHYGFQSTGAHFLDFCDIKLQPEERPEDLFQRLTAFIEDNLLVQNGGITHHDAAIEEDEELSPTLENFVVLTWLQLIHKDLPRLVKQRYGTELRSRTLASIKPEISQALPSLLDEVHSSEEVKVMRSAASRFDRGAQRQKPRRTTLSPKVCALCKQAGRANIGHFLSQCSYLPDSDKRYIAKTRRIAEILEDVQDDSEEYEETDIKHQPSEKPSNPTSILRIQVGASPSMTAFYGHRVANITIDCGATGNMIRLSTATFLGVQVETTTRSARQADGISPLKVIGETRFKFERDGKKFNFEGLVVENLDVGILAGIPFMELNDITVRPARHQIILGDGTTYLYNSRIESPGEHSVRRTHVLRAPSKNSTIWPGQFVEVTLPQEFVPIDTVFAIEARTDTPNASRSDPQWPCTDTVTSVAGKVRIPNLTDSPQVLKRHEHFCQVHATSIVWGSQEPIPEQPKSPPKPLKNENKQYSLDVKLDPGDTLPTDVKDKFSALLFEYDEVFNPTIHGYNGASGPFQAVVNMGPVQPPQRKGRCPQYSRNKLVELQDKFDDLERMGVFARPEDVDVSVEYINPSFLVKKSSGGHRLVTAFADVGRYAKPQPSLMPDVDSTLRLIASWKYIITTDLTLAFHQIPLAKESFKYCGVATPFKGVRVYTKCAMGMPGSETALEELMCRVLGELLEEGVVTKLADDLYCGADNLDDLLQNWRQVLDALHRNGLRLAARKTIITPKSATILGWIWEEGTIRASPHRISTLSTCDRPEKVSDLRSFIGAFKVLARVLPNCASLVAPLDEAQAGKLSQDGVKWTDDLLVAFNTAKSSLSDTRTITLPRPDDQLWVITDGAVKRHGIGATLYVTRDGKPKLAGFFSAKLRGRQVTWLPCEIEALSIAVATKHFSPYIVQSNHKACILTDSKPCVQAFEKLCRGEFSASPRVSTFLSTVSRYQASIRHLTGAANVPSDFASRNAIECTHPTCQVCSFVQRTEECVVSRLSVQDIMKGNAKLPYTSRAAWLALQAESPELRRTHAHLSQGTRPSKKQTDIKDIKRYLNVATIAKDGLLVVRRNEPLVQIRDCIIVPREVLEGLLTAIHIQLDHPSCHQLKLVTRRYFYALDMDRTIEMVSNSCHQCSSLSKVPHCLSPQSTCDPPERIGSLFAADVMKRERQLLLVIRECVTSYTTARIIADERHITLRDALLQMSVELIPLEGPASVIRVDPAPGFSALSNDELLKQHGIVLEIGRPKNLNKNPVAEKAIQELQQELLRLNPLGGTCTPLELTLAVSRLNTRIRNRGLSSREMLTQRDQFSHSQIPLSDRDLIEQQHRQRLDNHHSSEISKSPSGRVLSPPKLAVGDLVYLYQDGGKLSARKRYLIVSIDQPWCNIKKFTGAQLRSTSYRVKLTDCYKVQRHGSLSSTLPSYDNDEDSDEGHVPAYCPAPPRLPVVPPEISCPQNLTPIDAYPPPTPPYDPVMNPVNDRDSDMTTPCDISPSPPPRRSGRQRRLPDKFADYCMDT